MDHKVVWLELATDDVAAATTFWVELLGWEPSDSGSSLSAIIGAAPELGASIKENPGRGHIPSHWTPYIEVSDLEAATETAARLGATVLYKAHELPDGRGSASTILDPTGAPMSLWQRAAG